MIWSSSDGTGVPVSKPPETMGLELRSSYAGLVRDCGKWWPAQPRRMQCPRGSPVPCCRRSLLVGTVHCEGIRVESWLLASRGLGGRIVTRGAVQSIPGCLGGRDDGSSSGRNDGRSLGGCELVEPLGRTAARTRDICLLLHAVASPPALLVTGASGLPFSAVFRHGHGAINFWT